MRCFRPRTLSSRRKVIESSSTHQSASNIPFFQRPLPHQLSERGATPMSWHSALFRRHTKAELPHACPTDSHLFSRSHTKRKSSRFVIYLLLPTKYTSLLQVHLSTFCAIPRPAFRERPHDNISNGPSSHEPERALRLRLFRQFPA